MVNANLIPAKRQQAKRRRRRYRMWVLLCAAYSLLLLGAYGLCRGVWGEGDDALDGELAKVATGIRVCQARLQALRTEQLRAQAKLEANQAVGNQPDFSALLALLSESLDDEVVLKKCQLGRGLQASTVAGLLGSPRAAPPPAGDALALLVTGYGRSQAAVASFVLRLEQAELFGKVNLVKANREPLLAGQAVAFLIECTL